MEATGEAGVGMDLSAVILDRADALEREAQALRKLDEAQKELGSERLLALLAPLLNGNGNGNGHAVAGAVEVAPKPEHDGARGREAVRLIVGERPAIWALSDLRAEMKRRGWFTSNKGVDVAV